MILALLKLMRPHQWSKNLLVFVSILVGHQYQDLRLLSLTLLCFCALCLIASAGYVVNDLVDVEDDRNHPHKKNRPLPSGQISRTAAIVFAVLLGGLFAPLIGRACAWRPGHG